MKAETPASASIKRGQIHAKTNKQTKKTPQKNTFLNAPQSDFDSATDFW